MWDHALSIEDKRNTDDRLAELAFMKDLFETKLPIGDNKKHVIEYFSRLEELIDTEQQLINECFERDESDRDYHYFSAAVLKERASRSDDNTNRLDMEVPGTSDKLDDQVQDMCQVPPDIQCVPERPKNPISFGFELDGSDEDN